MALREARENGALQGVVYLRCEAPGCSVTEVEVRADEAREGVKHVQPTLACPLCKGELTCYDIRPVGRKYP